LSLVFIAHGRTADIAPYGSGQVIKLFKAGFPRTTAEEEYRISLLLHGKDISTPQAYGLAELDGRYGIVYEHVEGVTMLQAIGRRPMSCFSVSARMADVHAEFHRRTVGRALPGQKESLHVRIEEAPYLTDDEKRRIMDVLMQLPEGEQLCHGDYHPDNVMIGKRTWVLDWMTGVSGHPAGDVMRTALLLKYGTIPEETPRMTARVIALIRRAMLLRYLQRYRRAANMSMGDIEAWFLPVAAARLAEWIPEPEKAVLLRDVRKRLNARREGVALPR